MFRQSIFLWLFGFVFGQYQQWSTISWQSNNVNYSAEIIRAVGYKGSKRGTIDCRMLEDCSITLNITHVLTMTLYEYDPTSLTDSGGFRGVDGNAIRFNPDGSFTFRYSEAPPKRNITTFLWPIIADGYLGDGHVERRSVIVVNNQIPGPTIIARQNQRVNARVVNNLASESISIHWHGQHVTNDPWADGVAHITQCPIDPYNEFTYSFTPAEVGTHWYHSHSGAQRTDGLFGSLVVTSDKEFEGTDLQKIKDDILDLPDEHTLSLLDWQHENSLDFFSIIQSGSFFKNPVDSEANYEAPKIYDGSEVAPYPFTVALVNGLGWEFSPVNRSDCTHKHNPLNFFDVTADNVYRFRIVGAQSAYAFRLSIEGHKMRLIATDGILVRTDPEEVDYIILHAGERYDFLLNTTGVTPGNYWIVAETLETSQSLTSIGYGCLQGRRAYAVLHYNGASYESWPPLIDYDPTNRCTTQSKCYATNCPFQDFPPEYNIMCLNVRNFTQRTTDTILELADGKTSVFLNFGFGGDTTVSGSSINGRHFLFPPSPPLTQFSDLEGSFWLNNSCEYSQGKVERGRRCLHVYTIDEATVVTSGAVEMVFMNFIRPDQKIGFAASHPVHLHGHHFQVMHIGYGDCSNNGSCTHPDITCGNDYCDFNVMWTDGRTNFGEGTASPRKDTVIVPVGGYVVIRFEADNPGWWFLHCHVEPHQLEGMTMVVREGTPPTPPASFPTCDNFPSASQKTSSAMKHVGRVPVLVSLLLLVRMLI